MKKITNAFMLAIWIFQLIYGIIHIVNGTNINPFVFVCAVLICIMRYIEKFFRT